MQKSSPHTRRSTAHMMNKPEILAPAGSFDSLTAAVRCGADAVYLGGRELNARRNAANFSNEELAQAVEYCHARGVKVYITLNTLVRDDEMETAMNAVRCACDVKADALILQDIGLTSLIRRAAPDMPLHASTQTSVQTLDGIKMLADMGFCRAVLPRELSKKEIEKIAAQSPIELEMFVHGAMCISMSGRCLLSAYMTGRDANRGACAQSCRWRYALMEEQRPGEYFPIEEDEHGTYMMNSKDLCLLPHLADVIATGVDSLKIEGRMKSVHYVASVTKAYRAAIDAYVADPGKFAIDPAWTAELGKVSHRPYTTGFALHRATADDQIYGSSSYEQTSDFIGLVRSYDAATGWATVEQRNHMRVGEEIELFQPTLAGFRQTLGEMTDEAGVPIDRAPHPQQIVHIRMEQPVEPYAIVRRDV